MQHIPVQIVLPGHLIYTMRRQRNAQTTKVFLLLFVGWKIQKKEKVSSFYNIFICFAGFPTHSVLAGTSLNTTLPAPIIAFSPITIPGKIVALAPIEAPAFTTVLKKISGYCFDRGFKSLVKVALGPMKTLSSMVIPSQI